MRLDRRVGIETGKYANRQIGKRARGLFFAYLLISSFVHFNAFAGDVLQLGGYYKNFSTAFDLPVLREPIIGAVNNRLRLNASYVPSDLLSFHLSYDFAPRVQDASLFVEGPVIVEINPLSYRAVDLDSPIYPEADDPVGSFGIFQNLDRAVVTLSTAKADINIGRQAIAWGSARAINPTDVIAPFTFEALDTEDRIGVDAIRVRVPVGVLGEFDTGYVFGDDFDFSKSAFFLRSQFNAVETDISILILEFRENFLMGFDLTRAIGGAGFWLEAAHVFADVLDDDPAHVGEDYLRASIGLDYSFSGETYGFVEYHFNQAGARNPEAYLTNLTQPAYTDGAVYLMGKHYLAPGLTYQITQLVTFSGQTLFNLSHPSILLSLQIEYNIAQDIYVAAGAFIGLGKRPEIVKGDDDALTQRFRSEFGGYPNIYFSAFRIYF